MTMYSEKTKAINLTIMRANENFKQYDQNDIQIATCIKAKELAHIFKRGDWKDYLYRSE